MVTDLRSAGADLSVVIGGHLCHRAGQLGYLHLPLVVPLDAAEQHLPLARLKTCIEEIYNNTE